MLEEKYAETCSDVFWRLLQEFTYNSTVITLQVNKDLGEFDRIKNNFCIKKFGFHTFDSASDLLISQYQITILERTCKRIEHESLENLEVMTPDRLMGSVVVIEAHSSDCVSIDYQTID